MDETQALTREELREALVTTGLESGELVYLERRGDRYAFRRVVPGGPAPAPSPDGDDPDAWMTYAGNWPERGADRWSAFFEDLLAELDSMTGGADRCRWPLSDPWTDWQESPA